MSDLSKSENEIYSLRKEKEQKIKDSKLESFQTSFKNSTPIDFIHREHKDIENGFNEMYNDFTSLENYIKLCNNDLIKAIKITPLYTDPNPFPWDITIKKEAEKIWQKVMKK